MNQLRGREDAGPGSESEPDVDIIAVSHNGAAVLARAIQSFTDSLRVGVRTIVVDNASSDDSLAVAGRLGAVTIPLDRNVGYGAGLNVGLARATAEWVACANQDIEVTPSAVSTLVGLVERYELETGVPCIAGPRIVTARGETAETCHELPSLPRQVFAFLVGEGASGVRDVAAAHTGLRRCGWVSAVFLLGRRETFRAVGGFDPSYFMYVEDVDFFRRLAVHGYHCVWAPEATVVHSGGRAKRVSPSMYAQTLFNWKAYYTAEYGRLAGHIVIVSGILGCLLRAFTWWCRSWRGNTVAREYAAMFSGAAVQAVRRYTARLNPSRDA